MVVWAVEPGRGWDRIRLAGTLGAVWASGVLSGVGVASLLPGSISRTAEERGVLLGRALVA